MSFGSRNSNRSDSLTTDSFLKIPFLNLRPHASSIRSARRCVVPSLLREKIRRYCIEKNYCCPQSTQIERDILRLLRNSRSGDFLRITDALVIKNNGKIGSFRPAYRLLTTQS